MPSLTSSLNGTPTHEMANDAAAAAAAPNKESAAKNAAPGPAPNKEGSLAPSGVSDVPEGPLGQGLQVVEKKVRNLEKRKVRITFSFTLVL